MTEEQARDELSALVEEDRPVPGHGTHWTELDNYSEPTEEAPGSFLMLPTIENHYTTSLVYLYDEEGSPHCLYMLTDEDGLAYGSAWEIERENVR